MTGGGAPMTGGGAPMTGRGQGPHDWGSAVLRRHTNSGRVMAYLLFSVVTMVFNGMVLKWGETRGQNRLAVMSFNYLFASLGTASIWMVQNGGLPSGTTLLLGPTAGIFYGVGLFLWMVAISKSGLGTSTAAMRISVVWPTLLSILLFSEIPSRLQGAGIGFALVSIGLLTKGNRGAKQTDGDSGWPWLVAVFLVTGGIGVVLKIFIELGHGEERMAFLALAFSTAAVLSWGAMLVKRAPIGGGDVLRGVLFGGGNMLTNMSLLMALESLPGTVAFPLNNSGVIVLTTLVGVLLWQEKPGRWGYGAIAAAVVSIILISM